LQNGEKNQTLARCHHFPLGGELPFSPRPFQAPASGLFCFT
jgi:hypothetical protein